MIQPGDHTNNSTKTLTNMSTGVVQATDGGTVELDATAGGTFTGGTFAVIGDSSFLFSNGATISNATMTTSGTGMFKIANTMTLTGITLTGQLDVTGSLAFDGTIESGGLITDNGTVTFPNGLDNEGGTVIIADDAVFRLAGDLTNDGTIQLGTSVGGELAYTGSPTLSGTGTLG